MTAAETCTARGAHDELETSLLCCRRAIIRDAVGGGAELQSVPGRDWATATAGTQITITQALSGLASFTAQLGQDHATVYGGLVGLNYAFGRPG